MIRLKDNYITLSDKRAQDAYVRVTPAGLDEDKIALFLGTDRASVFVLLTVDEAAELSALLEEMSAGIEEGAANA